MSVAEVFSASPDIHYIAPEERPTVLIAEDADKLRDALIEQLHRFNISPRVAKRGYEVLKLVEQFRPEVLLLDGLLPDMHGFEIARFVRHLDSAYRPRIAIVTAIYKHIRYQNEARLKYGIDDYLVKPVDDVSLSTVLRSAKRASQ